MIPAAILAGGKGTRLCPLTDKIPKSLVQVAGKPFIHHQLALLKREGVTDVVLCVGHLGDMIHAEVGDGSKFGLNVQYSHDEGFGTGGALRQALPLLGGTFFVLYGDSYLDTPYSHILNCFNQGWCKGLMTLSPDGVDYGLNILTSGPVAARWGKFDLRVIFDLLWVAGDLHQYRMGQHFYEIGSFKGLAETDALIRGKTEPISGHIETYFRDAAAIAQSIDLHAIEAMAACLANTRSLGGRLFILGVGGSASNASHAVNDFRKLCDIEAYAPTDNVSELTARTNDDGWETVFARWLQGSHVRRGDTVMVLSVGGGNVEKGVSINLVRALSLARDAGASIVGIVGRDGGYTAQVADACVIVPTLSPEAVTPHTESFQAVVWHSIVTHPKLLVNSMKW